MVKQLHAVFLWEVLWSSLFPNPRCNTVDLQENRTCWLFGEQGWRSGESTRQLPLWPGFKSQGRHHMWMELLLVFLLAPRGFSPCTPVFPSPQKPPRPNSNSIRNARTHFVGKQISIFVDCYKLQNNWCPNFIVPQVKEIFQIKRFFSLLPLPPPFPSFMVVLAGF